MNTEYKDYDTVANARLIKQVAKYYCDTQRGLEIYRDMDSQVLENMAIENLLHWKQELHNLIFNGINCHDRRVA